MTVHRFKRHADDLGADLLPPDRSRRIQKPLRQTVGDVIDADYIIVRDRPAEKMSPRRVHGLQQKPEGRPAFTAAQAQGAYPVLKRLQTELGSQLRQAELALQSLSERAFSRLVAAAIALVLLAFVPALVIGQQGAVDQGRVLDITHVNLTPQDANGMRVLLVNAIIENRSSRSVPLPRLRADLVTDGQVIASTYIDAPTDRLDGGHSRGIAARLQHPGGKTPELRLSFDAAGASSS
ncbi:hypothetical protein FE840_002905 [Peteryoungia desertarenae]|uniref:DUF3426 domain-containing protein n=1 Tax=Peteryoungia desertarenae TaxID=1813451 RepID=A0ABX6QJW7_9HYPH|nr:DUF3426 domain-containing protein [Peteryoungia desertarenae]QLF68582.1 hypothetical protein FE840_002905 [Peteryoungia desertarenae]